MRCKVCNKVLSDGKQLALCKEHEADFYDFVASERGQKREKTQNYLSVQTFSWSVYPVEIVDVQGLPWLKVQLPSKGKLYNPLRETPNLFNEFCDIEVEQFVKKRGLLGIYQRHEEPLHEVAVFRSHVKHMRDIAQALVEGKSEEIAELKPLDEYFETLAIKRLGVLGLPDLELELTVPKGRTIKNHLAERLITLFKHWISKGMLRPAIFGYEARIRGLTPKLAIYPSSLAGVILIQLYNYWSEGKQLRQCKLPGCNVLTTKDFCGDTHKNYYHTTRRRAREYIKEGKPKRYEDKLWLFTEDELKELFKD